MPKKKLYFTIACVVGMVLVGGFVVDSIRANPPGAMPGTFPITDEEGSIAVGRTVALANMAEDTRESQIVCVKSQKLSSNKFSQVLKESGDKVEPSAIVGPEPIGGIWLVTFSGVSSPRRLPYGAEIPVYSKIDILLDGRDGSVIGVHMHD